MHIDEKKINTLFNSHKNDQLISILKDCYLTLKNNVDEIKSKTEAHNEDSSRVIEKSKKTELKIIVATINRVNEINYRRRINLIAATTIVVSLLLTFFNVYLNYINEVSYTKTKNELVNILNDQSESSFQEQLLDIENTTQK